jgi:hypothetical protein
MFNSLASKVIAGFISIIFKLNVSRLYILRGTQAINKTMIMFICKYVFANIGRSKNNNKNRRSLDESIKKLDGRRGRVLYT